MFICMSLLNLILFESECKFACRFALEVGELIEEETDDVNGEIRPDVYDERLHMPTKLVGLRVACRYR